MLELRDVEVQYGAIRALHGISLAVPAGSVVVLLGANGAGKSTTLKAIAGLERLRAGQILFEGRPIHSLSPRDRVRLGICMAPEGRHIFPRLTVLENLRMGAVIDRDPARIRGSFKRVFSLFPRLQERDRQQAGTLSGGEQQMLAIGRALMARPKLLLLDEPTQGIAPNLAEDIFATLREINKAGTTVLLVEQNAVAALALAESGYILQTGRIVLHGTVAELTGNPAVRRAYLGG
jgi:branched-chain amino acid transport system ATP-binding protein